MNIKLNHRPEETRAPWRSLRLGAILFLAVSSLAIGAVAEQSTEQIVQAVQARLDATADFTAAVRQEMVLGSAGKTVSASGTVAFKKPGRMRWELKNGNAQTIVADGETLWFYQPEEEQVLKAPFQAAFRSTTPVSFLTGVGRIGDDFDVTLESSTPELIRLALKPRKAEAELGKLRLDVDPATYDIVGAEVVDPLGNVTRLRFTDLRRNLGLTDEPFQFKVPPGVDIIEAPIGN